MPDCDYEPYAWKAIVSLFARPYWSRVWVAQEIMAGPPVEIRCGSYILNVAGLRDVVWKMLRSRDLHPNIWQVYLFTQHIFHSGLDNRKLRLRSHAGLSFPEIIVVLSDSCCADPRDRLYGVLSFCGEEDRQSIRVDYAKSVRGVFLDIVCLWYVREPFYRSHYFHVLLLVSVAKKMLPDEFTQETADEFLKWLESALKQVQGRLEDVADDLAEGMIAGSWVTNTAIGFLEARLGWDVASILRLENAEWDIFERVPRRIKEDDHRAMIVETWNRGHHRAGHQVT